MRNSAQLNAETGVKGSLTYRPPAGTVLPAGTGQGLTVVFTPSDPGRYTSATGSVAITVLKAVQTIAFAVAKQTNR